MAAEHVVEGPAELRELALPSHEHASAGARCAAFTGRRVEQRVLAKDRLLKLAQLAAGLDPELAGQGGASGHEHLERVGLASGAVEREHQLLSHALAQRMTLRQLVELRNHVRMAAELQVGRDPVLERGGAQVLEPGDLRLRERLVPQVGERRPPPQRERARQRLPRERGVAAGERVPARLRLGLEALDVQLARVETELVPGRLGDQQLAAALRRPARRQRPPQAGHRHPQRRGGVVDPLRAPELLEETVVGHHLVGVQQQQSQQRPLPRPAEGQRASPVVYLERSEDPKVHGRSGRDRNTPVTASYPS